ncbi:hypothetical protein FHW68_004953 [Pseudomonas sp. Tn43]|nr:hypothetical protein [Pseudomonas sp. Tn43]
MSELSEARIPDAPVIQRLPLLQLPKAAFPWRRFHLRYRAAQR